MNQKKLVILFLILATNLPSKVLADGIEEFDNRQIQNLMTRSGNAATANRQAFIQIMMYNTRSHHDVAAVPVALAITDTLKNAPYTPATNIQAMANDIRNSVTSRQRNARGEAESFTPSTVNEAISFGVDAVGTAYPGSRAPLSLARSGLRLGQRLYSDATASTRQIESQQYLDHFTEMSDQNLETVFSALYDASQINDNTREGVRRGSGVNPSVNFGDFFNQHPEMRRDAMLLEIDQALRAMGDRTPSREELGNLFAGINRRLVDGMANQNQQFRLLKDHMDDIESMRISDAEKQALKLQAQQEAARRREAEAVEHRAIVDGSRSAFFILSTLAGFDNPTLANQISVTGNSAVTIYESVHSILSIASDPTMTNLASGMTSLAATGNILGAVMNISSLFGPQQESPMVQISRQLRDIQQQLDLMRREMHGRFDRIDTKLESIHRDLVDGINTLLIGQRLNTEQFQDINQKFLRAYQNIINLERDGRAYWQALFNFEQELHQGNYLDFGNYVTPSNASQKQHFNAGVVFFHTFATGHATDAIAQNPVAANQLTPEGAYNRFHEQEIPVFRSLNYLRIFASNLDAYVRGQRNNNTLQQSNTFDRFQNLADPVAWAAGSESFIQMFLVSSDAFLASLSYRDRTTVNAYLADITEAGAKVLNFINELKRTEVAESDSSPQTSSNHLPEYLESLLAQYQESAATLQNAINAESTIYANRYLHRHPEPSASPNSTEEFEAPANITPCPGVKDYISDTSLQWVPGDNSLRNHRDDTMEAIRAAAPALSQSLEGSPSNLKQLIAPILTEAHQLGLGNISFCYDYEWIFDHLVNWRGHPAYDNDIDLGAVQHWGRLKIILYSYYTPLKSSTPRAHVNDIQVQNNHALPDLPEAQRTPKLIFARSVTSTRMWNYTEVITSSEQAHHYFRHSLIGNFPELLAQQWKEGEQLNQSFVTTSQEFAVAGSPTVDLNEVTTAVSTLRRNARFLLGAQLKSAIDGEAIPNEESQGLFATIRQETLKLSGYKELIGAYVSLILPVSFQSDSDLRGLFFGNDSLPSQASFSQLAESNADLSLPANQQPLKVERLRQLLTRLLITEHRRETLPLLENTFSRLELLRKMLAHTIDRLPIEQAYQRAHNRIDALLDQ